MLVKETYGSIESPVGVLNSINNGTNICDAKKEEVTSDSCGLGTQTQLGDIPPEGCDGGRESNEENDKEGRDVPVDYQLLPEEFFQFEGIPPPLVSKAWFGLLYNDIKSTNELEKVEDDLGSSTDEDSLPLAKLLIRLRRKKRKKSCSSENIKKTSTKSLEVLPNANAQPKVERKKKALRKNQTNNFPLINRKRGRPRKVETTPPNFDNEFLNTNNSSGEDESFWNDEIDSPNVDNAPKEEIPVENEKEDLAPVSYNEHDYFKPVEVSLLQKEQNEDAAKPKKKKSVALGVKMENSKMSFPCLECGKSFSAASTLKNHKRIHNGTLLNCTECHKGFTTKYLLKCHMRIHNGDLFMCHKCGKGFTTAELLKVHSRGHTGDRPFVCNICQRSFPSASNLSQHKQTHDSEKKFLCFQCGSSFSQKRCLDGHMLTHAEKSHICNVCGKLWARKSDLIEHMRVHTGVKPYCCSVCPQKFTQASSLKRHQIVHMDVKPIQCLTCSKIFKCQEYYKRHMRKHEKEADYLFNNIIKDN